jgi:pimeloyl-ACP methyl ester carboxylesterase
LLWDVPDDPKGELRWSLSKIRRVLGDSLVADRETVAIDQDAVAVDAAELLAAVRDLDAAGTDAIERLASVGTPAFGEDLDMPRCPEFQAWLIAIREDVRRAQLALLVALVRRLEAVPDRALAYARMRVALDPLDEAARLELLRILVAAGRAEEAERQRRLAIDVLQEHGVPVPADLSRPLRASERPPAAERPKFQRIQFCTAPDGTRLAYAVSGSGPPLLRSANWMSHLEFEWENPFQRHWLAELSREHSLIRFDARGNGLSDRNPDDLSLDAFVSDMESVADTLSEQKFDLVGLSQGCAVAIAYAVRYPERVRKLVLFGSFSAGWCHSKSDEIRAQWNAMITLTEVGWGTDNPVFRQMFTSLFLPQSTSEQQGWFNELQRVSASPHEAQRLQRAIGLFDVRALLAEVRTPTIVFHCRGDEVVPFDAGRRLASKIEGAEFVGLDSDNHMPLEGEPAWAMFVERLRDFLAR